MAFLPCTDHISGLFDIHAQFRPYTNVFLKIENNNIKVKMADGRWQFYFWIGGDDGDSNTNYYIIF